MEETLKNFKQEILKFGIISHSKQDTLWSIAKKCSVRIGLPMAAGGLVMGANAGTVTLPGIGTISGGLAGFLAGLTGGTVTCTFVNMAFREELNKLLEDQHKF